MVVDRQHLSTSGSGSNLADVSAKKVKPAAPANLYRPPPLRRRTEALSISSSESSPDVITVPKTEKIRRPPKLRRPDIQVYVPRAKRVLAPVQSTALAPDPSSSRISSGPKKQGASSHTKQCEKEIGEIPSRITPFTKPGPLQPSNLEKCEQNTFLKKKVSSVQPVKVIDNCVPQFSRKSFVCNQDNEMDMEDGKASAFLSDIGSVKNVDDCISDLEENKCVCISAVCSVTDNSDTGDSREQDDPVSDSGYGELMLPCKRESHESDSMVDTASDRECNTTCDLCHARRESCFCSDSGQVSVLSESGSPFCVESDFSTDIESGSFSENSEDVLKLNAGFVPAHVLHEEDGMRDGLRQNVTSEGQRQSKDETSEEPCVPASYVTNKRCDSVPLLSVTEEDKKVENSSTEKLDSDAQTSDQSSDVRIKSPFNNSYEVESKQNKETSPDTKCTVDGCEDVSISSGISPPAGSSTPVTLNPDECSWEMMFDDNGDCLDPKLMEELTNAVGSVKIEKPKSDYNSYQNRPEILLDPGDEFSHVVEIYNFPASLKTEDLVAIFSPYKNGGFEIKWVDNTHALGVFSSSLIAADVLATEHPFVKTRPLREASHESRMKARRSAEFLQPYKSRPETCAALARRLVTGALGVKLNTSREEREAERRLLREAREKKRLAAKQRDEVWEGTLSAN